MGVNRKTRADARSDSGISSPQIAQKVVQNDRVNSRHCSGIDSPKVVQNEFAPSGEFLAPVVGDKMGSIFD